MNDERMKAFSESMRQISSGGRIRMWEVFQDFCELAYCAIAKKWQHPDRREKLEDRYMARAKNYDKEQLIEFANMLALTMIAVTETRRDFLGVIYEQEGFCDQKYGAQYFTPENLAELMISVTVTDTEKNDEIISISDPTCGSGRLLLAAGRIHQNAGIDITTGMWMKGTDLDFVCSQMTYLQMAFAGIPGIAVHGDTLSKEKMDWAITPNGAILYAKNERFRKMLEKKPPTLAPLAKPEPTQTDMFSEA